MNFLKKLFCKPKVISYLLVFRDAYIPADQTFAPSGLLVTYGFQGKEFKTFFELMKYVMFCRPYESISIYFDDGSIKTFRYLSLEQIRKRYYK